MEDISPFLEPSDSGITALWARTMALKHNCTILVGYPEKVDMSIVSQVAHRPRVLQLGHRGEW